jgi:hypothetical protein
MPRNLRSSRRRHAISRADSLSDCRGQPASRRHRRGGSHCRCPTRRGLASRESLSRDARSAYGAYGLTSRSVFGRGVSTLYRSPRTQNTRIDKAEQCGLAMPSRGSPRRMPGQDLRAEGRYPSRQIADGPRRCAACDTRPVRSSPRASFQGRRARRDRAADWRQTEWCFTHRSRSSGCAP